MHSMLMADPEDCRVFVGGLSWDTSDKRLEQAFRRFGKVLDAKVMIDKDTGRPRGFGFVTFGDEQSMEDAITGLHNGELDGRVISVSKAQSKLTGGRGHGYEEQYDNGGGRDGYYRGGGGGGGRGGGGAGSDDCFRCGRPGHWARDCPNSGGGSARFPPTYSGGGGSGYGGRPDRFGGGPSFGGSRYGGDDDRYGGGRERYGSSGRYGDSGYGRGGGRGGGGGGHGAGGYDRGGDRYGSGGPARYDKGFRDRPAPYGGRPGGRSSYDNRY